MHCVSAPETFSAALFFNQTSLTLPPSAYGGKGTIKWKMHIICCRSLDLTDRTTQKRGRSSQRGEKSDSHVEAKTKKKFCVTQNQRKTNAPEITRHEIHSLARFALPGTSWKRKRLLKNNTLKDRQKLLLVLAFVNKRCWCLRRKRQNRRVSHQNAWKWRKKRRVKRCEKANEKLLFGRRQQE